MLLKSGGVKPKRPDDNRASWAASLGLGQKLANSYADGLSVGGIGDPCHPPAMRHLAAGFCFERFRRVDYFKNPVVSF